MFFLSLGYTDAHCRKITSIEFRGDLRAKEKNLRAILNIETGDTYSREAIRRAVYLLYAKGIYENIVVEATEHEDGIKLSFHLIGNYLIKSIKVKGNFPYLKSTILKAARIELGKEYDKSEICKARERLIGYFKGLGYRKTKVDMEEEIDQKSKDVKLTIAIDKGFRTWIDDVEIRGKPYFPDKKILRKSKLFYFIPFILRGKVLKRSNIETSLQSLEEFYHDKGFHQAEIKKPEIILSEEKNLAQIILKLNSGINIRFDVKGSFFWLLGNKREIARELVRISKQFVFDEETYLQNVGNKIKNFFVERGFNNANVDWTVEKKKDTLFITYRIETGERIEIENIIIIGNDKEKIPDKMIKKLMLTQASGIIKRYFSPAVIREDLENIVSYYHTKGFLEAVADHELSVKSDDARKAEILIKISQGKRIRVGQIIFEGNETYSDGVLKDLLSYEDDDPFDVGKVIEGKKAICLFYQQNGYANSHVEEEYEVDQSTKQARIKYKIVEGKQFQFGKIIIEGLPRTKRGIILNNIGFKEGEEYSYKLLESSQRSLYKTKLFNKVEFKTRDYRNKKDVIYKFAEKKRTIFDFKLGYNQYENFDFITTGYLINPFSLGSTFAGHIEFSGIKESYKVTLSKSRYLFDIYSHLSYLRLKKDSYNVKTFGFRFELKRHFRKWLEGSVGYHYDSAELFNVQPEAVLEWEDEGHVNVGSLVFSAFVDKRDDPILTTQGFLGSFSAEYASKYFGSKTNPLSTIEYHFLPEEQRKKAKPSPLGYMKFYLKTAAYLPLSKKIVFALSLQGGTAYSYEGTDILPIHKRFFLGGSNTIRGFPLDTVQSDSVKNLKPSADPETPIGGNGMFCANSELRMEVINKWWLVLFSDMGNIWADIGEFGKIKGDLRYTAGAGIRWITPIGPLRFDYGFKLDRKEGESKGEWYITLGHTF